MGMTLVGILKTYRKEYLVHISQYAMNTNVLNAETINCESLEHFL